MSSPWPDEALVCSAIEREIERWARLRKAQGSKPPRCTPASYVSFIYGSTARAAAGMRRLEKQGLVRRRKFDCGGNGWALTPKGSALAQEVDPPCRSCVVRDALPVPREPRRNSRRRLEHGLWETYDRCPGCLAELLEEQVERAEGTVTYYEEQAEEYRGMVAEMRDRIAHLRVVAAH